MDDLQTLAKKPTTQVARGAQHYGTFDNDEELTRLRSEHHVHSDDLRMWSMATSSFTVSGTQFCTPQVLTDLSED